MSDNKKLSMKDFTFIKDIGEGAYGRAVLCRRNNKTNEENEELVVIKEIALANLSEQEQRDAWKEIKVLSYLHHPNIISYLGSFMENNVLHIAMEYADNGDLFEQVQNAKGQHFKEDQILDWFVQMCLALKHIHDRKILHRDIKCQNVFLMKNGMVKMGDFGIAKVLDHTTQFSKTAIGTPYYLSPEICQGKAYNQKSDVWSLGCVLYELCTLQHAFDSNCMNGLIMKILRSKHSPIPHYYSPNLRNLVDTLLHKDPKKRPNVNQILNFDFIRSRISNLLSATLQQIEFSHTVFHGLKAGETPTALKNDQKTKDEGENIDQKPQNSKIPTRLKSSESIPKQSQPSQQQSDPNSSTSSSSSSANANNNKDQQNSSLQSTSNQTNNNNNNNNNSAIRNRSPNRVNSNNNIDQQMLTKGEVLLAKKNAIVKEERAKQKEMRQKKVNDEKMAEEKSLQKRQEIEEKIKKRGQERIEQFKAHEQEVKDMHKKFDNLNAPFKSVKDSIKASPSPSSSSNPNSNPNSNPTSNPASNPKSQQTNSANSNKTKTPSGNNLAKKSSSNEMEGTKRPGQQMQGSRPSQPNVAAEQKNLREFLAKRRAELKQKKLAEKADEEAVIQIGSFEVKVNSNEEEQNNTDSKTDLKEEVPEEKHRKHRHHSSHGNNDSSHNLNEEGNKEDSNNSKNVDKKEEKKEEIEKKDKKEAEKKDKKETDKKDKEENEIKEKKEEKKEKSKNLEDLIKFSDSDYDDENEGGDKDDFVSLASMFKKILDEPPPQTDDNDNDNDDNNDTNDDNNDNYDNDDVSRERSCKSQKTSRSGVFFFGGKELKLASVNDRDSLFYRVEAIRQFIEGGLGLDKFIEIYRFVTVDSDNTSEADTNRKIHEILSTPEELSYYNLIQQLVVCEETLNES